MSARMLAIAAAVVVALSAGLGTYVAVRGSSQPPVSKAQQSPILERARDTGIISDYRVVSFRPQLGRWRYSALDGQLDIHYMSRCAGNRSCPSADCGTLWISYRHTVEATARRILPIAQSWAKRTCSGDSMVSGPPDYRWHKVNGTGIRVVFGPPYYP